MERSITDPHLNDPFVNRAEVGASREPKRLVPAEALVTMRQRRDAPARMWAETEYPPGHAAPSDFIS
jgi:hypothetical protein